MNVQSTIVALKSVATVTPEFPPEAVETETTEELAALVTKYPALTKFSDYVEFLKLTGGAHIHNEEFSIGFYGFGGFVVTSFDEGLFLDDDRFFCFGEVLYYQKPEPVYVFAFDFESDSDLVLTSPIEESDYVVCATSFLGLLNSFAGGKNVHV